MMLSVGRLANGGNQTWWEKKFKMEDNELRLQNRPHSPVQKLGKPSLSS